MPFPCLISFVFPFSPDLKGAKQFILHFPKTSLFPLTQRIRLELFNFVNENFLRFLFSSTQKERNSLFSLCYPKRVYFPIRPVLKLDASPTRMLFVFQTSLFLQSSHLFSFSRRISYDVDNPDLFQCSLNCECVSIRFFRVVRRAFSLSGLLPNHFRAC